MSAAATTFYKLEIQGIVYLVDPATAIAHTYDLADPTPIGRVLWNSPATLPRITLFDDWEARLAAKKMTWAGYPAGAIPTNDNALSPASATS
jgi:hypothetical protein